MDPKKVLVAFLVAYSLLFLFLYPKYYLDVDESQYLRSASFLLKGKLWLDSEEKGYVFMSNGSRYFSLYPPGQMLILAPFVLFGIRAAFLSGLLLHILGFVVFYKLVKQYGLNPLASLLYLLFPVFVYFNQRIYSDYTATVLVLAGFYFLRFSKKDWLSSFFFGLAFLTRPVSLALFLPMLAVEFLENRKKAFWTGALTVPFLLFYLVYNQYVTGSMLFGAYSYFTQEGGLFMSLSSMPMFMPLNALFTVVYLTLLYPGMLPGFFKAGMEKKDRSLLVPVSVYLAFTLFWMVSTGVLWPRLSLLSCYRYIMPAIPFMLIPYAAWLERNAKRYVKLETLYLAIGACLLLSSAAVMVLNSWNTARNQNFVADLYANTDDGSLIVGNAISFIMQDGLGDRDYLDVGDTHSVAGYDHSFGRISQGINEHESAYLVVYGQPETPEERETVDRIIHEYRTTLVLNKTYSSTGMFSDKLWRFDIVMYKING